MRKIKSWERSGTILEKEKVGPYDIAQSPTECCTSSVLCTTWRKFWQVFLLLFESVVAIPSRPLLDKLDSLPRHNPPAVNQVLTKKWRRFPSGSKLFQNDVCARDIDDISGLQTQAEIGPDP